MRPPPVPVLPEEGEDEDEEDEEDDAMSESPTYTLNDQELADLEITSRHI